MVETIIQPLLPIEGSPAVPLKVSPLEIVKLLLIIGEVAAGNVSVATALALPKGAMVPVPE